MVTCFMVRPTDRFDVRLRRYGGEGCPGPYGYHNAISAPIERIQSNEYPVTGDLHAHDDARWPVKCDYCDHVFGTGDVWQRSVERIYVADDGREMLLSDRVPGMMYFLEHRHRQGRHGRTAKPDVLAVHRGSGLSRVPPGRGLH